MLTLSRYVQHALLYPGTNCWWPDQFVVEALEGKKRDTHYRSSQWVDTRGGVVQYCESFAGEFESAASVKHMNIFSRRQYLCKNTQVYKIIAVLLIWFGRRSHALLRGI